MPASSRRTERINSSVELRGSSIARTRSLCPLLASRLAHARRDEQPDESRWSAHAGCLRAKVKPTPAPISVAVRPCAGVDQ